MTAQQSLSTAAASDLRRANPRNAVSAGVNSAAALLALAALALTGCDKKPAAAAGPPPAMPVTVYTVEPTDVPISNEWVGTLDGFVNAQIQPQVSGYLIKQEYKEGLPVSKGQVLFQIDPRPFQALVDQALGQLAQAKGQVAQTQSQVAQAKATLGLAEINVNRDTPLAEARAIAKSQLDNDTQTREADKAAVAAAEAQVTGAQAAVKSAEAQVATARLNLGFTQVRSLISGVAGQATLQVGNLVNPQSVLTSVSQLDPVKVFFSISDSEYLSLTKRAKSGGQSDLLHGASNVPLTLTLANGQVYPQKGRIQYVDRQVNAQTGAIRIAALFPNPGNVLRPGQFGRVKAETEVQHNAILVPAAAVQELQGQEQIYTVSPSNTVKILNITLGPQITNPQGSFWVVSDGVPAGTQIITDNLLKLREGSPVQPHQAPPQAPTATVSGTSAGR
jgi:membrane fusion protein (multidrug efflux system)